MTAGNLSTAPRTVKAADALSDAGYQVHVVSANRVAWARETDRELHKTRRWRWTQVDYDAQTARATYLWTGLRARASRAVVTTFGANRTPLPICLHASFRIHVELARAAVAGPAHLIYGSAGGLHAASEAARRLRVPFVLDLEDFHSREQCDPADRWMDDVHGRLERSLLPRAAALLTSSRSIADAYDAKYGTKPSVVHNVSVLPDHPPNPAASSGGLRLYWFSQTIGPGRGLEDAIRAMGLASIPGELHLRGRPAAGYLEALCTLQAHVAPALRLVHHPPAAPDRMVALCAPYDIGLAAEEPTSMNRDLCLSNKVLTYPLAGLAVVCSATSGVRELVQDVGSGALVYRSGDVSALAAGLRRWASDRASLVASRAAAWAAAVRRWHWEHPCERQVLVDTVAQALR